MLSFWSWTIDKGLGNYGNVKNEGSATSKKIPMDGDLDDGPSLSKKSTYGMLSRINSVDSGGGR